MRNPFTAIWDYFRPSWEGDDGQFSYKRASQFTFVGLISYMAISNKVHDKYTWFVFLTLAVLFALVAAIISVPQLITLAKLGLNFKGTAVADINSLTNEASTKDNSVASPDSGTTDTSK